MTRTARKLADMFGRGIGQPWVEWTRKIDKLADGLAVLDALNRKDWPGDDESWDRFVAEQERARAACGARADEAWEPPPVESPARIPSGFWRGLSQLEQTAAVDRAGEWVADWHHPEIRQRRGLLLGGPVGTGKTAIAAAIAHDTDGWAFWPVVDLVQHLMDGYGDNSFGYRFGALARRSILIVDDLGAERDTDGQTDLVVKLLDARHRGDGHTIISTNLTSKLREVRYGQRIESRLRDMCETVAVVGDDRRAA